MNEKVVYVAVAGEEAIKVGVSKNPESRVQTLNTGNPKKIELRNTLEMLGTGEDAEKWESQLHNLLEEYRLEGEWFEYDAIDYLTGYIKGTMAVDPDEDTVVDVVETIENETTGKLVTYDFAEGEIEYYAGLKEVIQPIADKYNLPHGVCNSCGQLAYYHTAENDECLRCGASKGEDELALFKEGDV